ncbi:MAG: hypothetical protein OSA11_10515 [Candidatus Nanopelagicales bacterium]|nr:hypothetical protein [Candidatus Nanopelagicales bacterium]
MDEFLVNPSTIELVCPQVSVSSAGAKKSEHFPGGNAQIRFSERGEVTVVIF